MHPQQLQLDLQSTRFPFLPINVLPIRACNSRLHAALDTYDQVRFILSVASFSIMKRMNVTLICRAVMGFGASCSSYGDRKKCLSHWNNSAFHIAISHSTNANEMYVWMPVVQALTQHPIIDWVGLHGQFHMQRLCFSKLIVGQTAALHLYNDHRLPPFPSSHPHPQFDISGLYCAISQVFINFQAHLLAIYTANIIRCIAFNLEKSLLPSSSTPSFNVFGGKNGIQGPSNVVVGLIGTVIAGAFVQAIACLCFALDACYPLYL